MDRIQQIKDALNRAARDADTAMTLAQYSSAMQRWWDAKFALRDAAESGA